MLDELVKKKNTHDGDSPTAVCHGDSSGPPPVSLEVIRIRADLQLARTQLSDTESALEEARKQVRAISTDMCTLLTTLFKTIKARESFRQAFDRAAGDLKDSLREATLKEVIRMGRLFAWRRRSCRPWDCKAASDCSWNGEQVVVETHAGELFEEWKAQRLVAVQEFVESSVVLAERGDAWVKEHQKPGLVEKIVLPGDRHQHDKGLWCFASVCWLDSGVLK